MSEVENGALKTLAQTRALALRTLNSALLEGVSVSFDALPVPHLDPQDEVSVSTEGASLTFPLRQASIPLAHGGVMSVGTVRRVSANQQKIRGR